MRVSTGPGRMPDPESFGAPFFGNFTAKTEELSDESRSPKRFSLRFKESGRRMPFRRFAFCPAFCRCVLLRVFGPRLRAARRRSEAGLLRFWRVALPGLDPGREDGREPGGVAAAASNASAFAWVTKPFLLGVPFVSCVVTTVSAARQIVAQGRCTYSQHGLFIPLRDIDCAQRKISGINT